MEIFYCADMHFGHENIIGFDERPYNCISEMEEGLVKNWNAQISSKDLTYILGDFCWSSNSEEWARILKRLKGKKILIKGNHDPENNNFYKKVNLLAKSKGFLDIRDFYEETDSIYKVLLSHYPMLAYKKSYNPFTYMLFGHVHNTNESKIIDKFINELRANCVNRYDNKGNLINVSICRSYMNYTPQTLEYLINKNN